MRYLRGARSVRNFDNPAIPGAAGHSGRPVVRWLAGHNLTNCHLCGTGVDVQPERKGGYAHIGNPDDGERRTALLRIQETAELYKPRRGLGNRVK